MKNTCKPQYSKFVHISSLVIFVFVLAYSLTSNGDGMYNTIIYTTAITISGTLCALTVVWYLKKSQVENVYKLQCHLVEVISDTEIKTTKEKLHMKKEYGVADFDLEEICNSSSLDEFKEKTITDIQSELDDAMNDAKSPVEISSIQQI